MKFTSSVDLNVPMDKAVSLYTNPLYFKEWQDGFISYEHISGTPRQAGAKSKIIYVNGKHKIELIETIQIMNLPSEMAALYEHKHMVNTLITNFSELPDRKTRLTTSVGYTKFIGIMPKLMALVMPGMFKKQSQKWLDQFKVFAEK